MRGEGMARAKNKAVGIARRLLAIVCSFALACALVPAGLAVPENARAAGVTIVGSGTFADGLSWQLDSQATLTISGNGPMHDYNYTNVAKAVPWRDMGLWADPETAKQVVISEGVTEIGARVFFGEALVSVTLPTTLTRIGQAAFFQCEHIETCNLSDCCNLKTIEQSAFYEAHLPKIILPASVESIGDSAFYDCKSPISFAENAQLKTIGERAFMSAGFSEIHIPASVESIGTDAFRNFYGDSLTFAENSQLATIDVRAFYYGWFKSVRIPASVTSISMNAFANCPYLESFAFEPGSQIQSINWSMLNSCPNLKSVEIPASITEVDSSFIDSKGRFQMNKTDLICYSHGEYMSLGKRLGTFGFSVRKKRPAKKRR